MSVFARVERDQYRPSFQKYAEIPFNSRQTAKRYLTNRRQRKLLEFGVSHAENGSQDSGFTREIPQNCGIHSAVLAWAAFFNSLRDCLVRSRRLELPRALAHNDLNGEG